MVSAKVSCKEYQKEISKLVTDLKVAVDRGGIRSIDEAVEHVIRKAGSSVWAHNDELALNTLLFSDSPCAFVSSYKAIVADLTHEDYFPISDFARAAIVSDVLSSLRDAGWYQQFVSEHDNFAINIASRLQQLCKDKFCGDDRQMSNAVGVSKTIGHSIVAGEKAITGAFLAGLSKIPGIDWNWLITGDSQLPPVT